ncbi:MAG: hypothetical protein IPL62_20725 [Caulobacteraceae bacterium]|nr:hypothetical protein [Caulobacteraceae bacterium]
MHALRANELLISTIEIDERSGLPEALEKVGDTTELRRRCAGGRGVLGSQHFAMGSPLRSGAGAGGAAGPRELAADRNLIAFIDENPGKRGGGGAAGGGRGGPAPFRP